MTLIRWTVGVMALPLLALVAVGVKAIASGRRPAPRWLPGGQPPSARNLAWFC
jgi:hypothetical protein